MQCRGNYFAEALWKCPKDFKQKTEEKIGMVGLLLGIQSVLYTYVPS